MTGRLAFPLRAVDDADADALISLIAAAYREYPGCVLDLPGVDDDLPAPATTAARRGGRWWVATDGPAVVATVGAGPFTDEGTVELKRLYVARTHRRRGLASRLLGQVEAQAAGLGANEVELWSDTRFGDAHRFYARHGYVDTGDRRRLHDPSDTTEIHFRRDLDPVAPRRRVLWTGPFGHEECELADLPDGAVLRGHVGGTALTYRVEVDRGWRTRAVTVSEPTGSRQLTSDGAGRWWQDGREASELAGCTDVDIEATPVTNTLPIRRALASGHDHAEPWSAWIRVPGPDIVPTHQRYRQLDDDRWRYSSATFEAELSVDDDGLVVSYGELWHRGPRR